VRKRKRARKRAAVRRPQRAPGDRTALHLPALPASHL